jgi:hypothetical protein
MDTKKDAETTLPKGEDPTPDPAPAGPAGFADVPPALEPGPAPSSDPVIELLELLELHIGRQARAELERLARAMPSGRAMPLERIKGANVSQLGAHVEGYIRELEQRPSAEELPDVCGSLGLSGLQLMELNRCKVARAELERLARAATPAGQLFDRLASAASLGEAIEARLSPRLEESAAALFDELDGIVSRLRGSGATPLARKLAGRLEKVGESLGLHVGDLERTRETLALAVDKEARVSLHSAAGLAVRATRDALHAAEGETTWGAARRVVAERDALRCEAGTITRLAGQCEELADARIVAEAVATMPEASSDDSEAGDVRGSGRLLELLENLEELAEVFPATVESIGEEGAQFPALSLAALVEVLGLVPAAVSEYDAIRGDVIQLWGGAVDPKEVTRLASLGRLAVSALATDNATAEALEHATPAELDDHLKRLRDRAEAAEEHERRAVAWGQWAARQRSRALKLIEMSEHPDNQPGAQDPAISSKDLIGWALRSAVSKGQARTWDRKDLEGVARCAAGMIQRLEAGPARRRGLEADGLAACSVDDLLAGLVELLAWSEERIRRDGHALARAESVAERLKRVADSLESATSKRLELLTVHDGRHALEAVAIGGAAELSAYTAIRRVLDDLEAVQRMAPAPSFATEF